MSLLSAWLESCISNLLWARLARVVRWCHKRGQRTWCGKFGADAACAPSLPRSNAGSSLAPLCSLARRAHHSSEVRMRVAARTRAVRGKERPLVARRQQVMRLLAETWLANFRANSDSIWPFASNAPRCPHGHLENSR